MNIEIKSMSKQRGMSSLGWLCVILLFGFGVTCAYRVAPPYYDNWKIQQSLESLEELSLTEREFDGASDSQVKSHLSKYFQVNGISHEVLDYVKITRTKGRAYVDLNWDIQTHLIANIDVVITFKNQFDSLRPAECCKPEVDNSVKSE